MSSSSLFQSSSVGIFSIFLSHTRLCSHFTCRGCALDTLNVRTGFLEKVNLAV